jgi:peroxiredoxin
MTSTLISFNAFSLILLIGAVTAFVIAVASLIVTIVRWKSPNRGKHVRRLSISLAVIPFLTAVQKFAQWLVFFSAIGRQRLAEIKAAREEKLADTSLVRVGDPVPQFSLTTADGNEFSFPGGDYVTLINFFATWCGPCQIELPHIERIWAAHKHDEHFRMLVIGREETAVSVREYRVKNGFSFPIAADPDRTVYSLFAKESIPRTLVVSPDGRIAYSKTGFSEGDLDELNDVLRQQLASVK